MAFPYGIDNSEANNMSTKPLAPNEILQQNTQFYNAYATGKITKTQYEQAMAYQSQKLAESQAYYQQHPKVTTSEIQALQTQYPELYAQTMGAGKVVTDIEVTSQGISVSYMEQGTYKTVTGIPATLPQNYPEIVTPTPAVSPIFPSQEQFTKLFHVGQSPVAQWAYEHGLTLEQVNPATYTVVKTGLEVAIIAALAPEVLPAKFGLTTLGVIKGAALGVGVTQAFKWGSEAYSGQPLTILTPQEFEISAVGGAAFNVGSSVLFAGATKLAPVLAEEGLKGVVARAGLSASIVGGVSGVVSGGDLEAIAQGAIQGAAFSIGADVASYAHIHYIQPKVSGYLTQKYLETGKLTLFDRTLMKITGVPSPVKQYVVSGEPVSTWTLEREQATINRALIPKTTDTTGKLDISTWGKGTKWTKSESTTSTLNRYIGSGQKQVLEQFTLKPEVTESPLSINVKAVTTPIVAPVTLKSITPAVVTGIAQISFSEATQKQKNPFLTYQGKSYFQKPTAYEDIEYTVLSYPSTSPFAAPAVFSEPKSLVDTMAGLRGLQNLRSDIFQVPGVFAGVSTIPIQAQTTEQTVQQVQELKQVQQLYQQQQQSYHYPPQLNDVLKSFRKRKTISSGIGLASRKRRYPILGPMTFAGIGIKLPKMEKEKRGKRIAFF